MRHGFQKSEVTKFKTSSVCRSVSSVQGQSSHQVENSGKIGIDSLQTHSLGIDSHYLTLPRNNFRICNCSLFQRRSKNIGFQKYCSQGRNFIMKLQAHLTIFITSVYVTNTPTISMILENLENNQRIQKIIFFTNKDFHLQFTQFLSLKLQLHRFYIISQLQDILWSYLKNHKSNAYNAPANGQDSFLQQLEGIQEKCIKLLIKL